MEVDRWLGMSEGGRVAKGVRTENVILAFLQKKSSPQEIDSKPRNRKNRAIRNKK